MEKSETKDVTNGQVCVCGVCVCVCGCAECVDVFVWIDFRRLSTRATIAEGIKQSDLKGNKETFSI